MKNNDEPAFPLQWMDFQPSTGEQVVREQYPGMTLRDYFAAKALNLVCGDDGGTVEDAAKEIGIEATEYKSAVHWPKLCAVKAYRFADAMMEARKPKGETK